MKANTRIRKMSFRIDVRLKAEFEKALWGIGMEPTCAVRCFAYQVVRAKGLPFAPAAGDFEMGGKTTVASVKLPEEVAGELEAVLGSMGTNLSQAVRLLALQTVALGGMPFAPGMPAKAE